MLQPLVRLNCNISCVIMPAILPKRKKKNAVLPGLKGLNTEYYMLTTIKHPRHPPQTQ